MEPRSAAGRLPPLIWIGESRSELGILRPCLLNLDLPVAGSVNGNDGMRNSWPGRIDRGSTISLAKAMGRHLPASS